MESISYYLVNNFEQLTIWYYSPYWADITEQKPILKYVCGSHFYFGSMLTKYPFFQAHFFISFSDFIYISLNLKVQSLNLNSIMLHQILTSSFIAAIMERIGEEIVLCNSIRAPLHIDPTIIVAIINVGFIDKIFPSRRVKVKDANRPIACHK